MWRFGVSVVKVIVYLYGFFTLVVVATVVVIIQMKSFAFLFKPICCFSLFAFVVVGGGADGGGVGASVKVTFRFTGTQFF